MAAYNHHAYLYQPAPGPGPGTGSASPVPGAHGPPPPPPSALAAALQHHAQQHSLQELPPAALSQGLPAYPAVSSASLYDQLTAAAAAAAASDSLADQYARNQTRLPPILQVEKQHVTTSATQAASASRRRNDALFKCPVPGCGSTFTRRFNLRGHLRSHTEERPFVCEWPGCGKGFARQHDCKRHQALHSSKAGAHACAGCGKTFSRMDALNRHLRSDGGAECREIVQSAGGGQPGAPAPPRAGRRDSPDDARDSERSSRTPSVGLGA